MRGVDCVVLRHPHPTPAATADERRYACPSRDVDPLGQSHILSSRIRPNLHAVCNAAAKESLIHAAKKAADKRIGLLPTRGSVDNQPPRYHLVGRPKSPGRCRFRPAMTSNQRGDAGESGVEGGIRVTLGCRCLRSWRSLRRRRAVVDQRARCEFAAC